MITSRASIMTNAAAATAISGIKFSSSSPEIGSPLSTGSTAWVGVGDSEGLCGGGGDGGGEAKGWTVVAGLSAFGSAQEIN